MADEICLLRKKAKTKAAIAQFSAIVAFLAAEKCRFYLGINDDSVDESSERMAIKIGAAIEGRVSVFAHSVPQKKRKKAR